MTPICQGQWVNATIEKLIAVLDNEVKAVPST